MSTCLINSINITLALAILWIVSFHLLYQTGTQKAPALHRYISMYFLEDNLLEVYREDEPEWREKDPTDFIWQYAPDRETARDQHFDKLDEWELDPTKDTY